MQWKSRRFESVIVISFVIVYCLLSPFRWIINYYCNWLHLGWDSQKWFAWHPVLAVVDENAPITNFEYRWVWLEHVNRWRSLNHYESSPIYYHLYLEVGSVGKSEPDNTKKAKYPCVPKPFHTVMGTVMICNICGHGYEKPDSCKVKEG